MLMIVTLPADTSPEMIRPFSCMVSRYSRNSSRCLLPDAQKSSASWQNEWRLVHLASPFSIAAKMLLNCVKLSISSKSSDSVANAAVSRNIESFVRNPILATNCRKFICTKTEHRACQHRKKRNILPRVADNLQECMECFYFLRT